MKKLKHILSALLIAVMLVGIAPMSGIDLSVKSSAMDLSSYKVGDLIEFGSYPQSEVKDEAIIAELDKISEAAEWISYNYYVGTGTLVGSTGMACDGKMKASDYMIYADILYNGEKYRAVKFLEYRPSDTGYTSSKDNSYQDDNGYYTNIIYYFKFESLVWRILDPMDNFVMCNSIIDSQAYQNFIYHNGTNFYNSLDCINYASDWATSSIRNWLNNEFYNTAFSINEKEHIGISNLENKSVYINGYDGVETEDKIFLISFHDSLNSAYGFNPLWEEENQARQLECTDYAKCQGAYTDESSNYNSWWLRSPSFSINVAAVDYTGHSEYYYPHGLGETNVGVVPAFKFNPKTSHTHTLNHITVPSTCKVAGMEYDICTECGETLNEKTLPLAAHKWNDWTVEKEPTATEEGIEKRTCSACGDSETRSIDKFNGLRDSETGVEIIYNDEYSDGTELKVEEKFSGKSFQLIDTAYGKTNTAIYDISTYKDGVKVQPNGEITVRVPLPKGFSANKVFVCYVDSTNGKVTKIPCKVKDGYVIFKTDHFSEYAVVEQLACVKSVSVSDITLNYKKSATIKPTIKADDGAKYTVKYSSSNTKVATVDKNGKVYGAKKGTATITCTVTDSNGNTVQDTCKVTVKYSFGQWLIVILLFGWIWYI